MNKITFLPYLSLYEIFRYTDTSSSNLDLTSSKL